MMDRRTTRRYDLSLPVMFRVAAGGQTCSSNGKTRDISTGGVYLIINKDVNASAAVNLDVTFPCEVTGGAEVFVRIVGKVARVEKLAEEGHQHVGVAAVVISYEIVRNDSRVS
jgi:hypothetical protein